MSEYIPLLYREISRWGENVSRRKHWASLSGQSVFWRKLLISLWASNKQCGDGQLVCKHTLSDPVLDLL